MTRTINRREEVEQAKAVTWAQSQIAAVPAFRFLHHSPNGGLRNPVVAGQMKAMGTRKGFPDLVLPLVVERPRKDCRALEQRNGLAIEMKSTTGRLSPEQQEWIAHFAAQGWLCTVCRTAEEAIDALGAYVAGDFDRINRVLC